MSDHPIVHIELSTHDREASGAFYARLFGWKIQQMPEMDYAMFESSEALGGGFNPITDEFPAGTVTFYVATDDIPASLARAEALGAEIVRTESEIPGMGWYAFFRDLSGNLVGLYKARARDG